MNSFLLAAEETTSQGSALPSLLFLVLMVAVFYFLIIRPQRRRAAQQKQMTENLEVGQDVRTIGGIHGTIVSMDDDSVVLRVEDGQIRVAKRAIGSRIGNET